MGIFLCNYTKTSASMMTLTLDALLIVHLFIINLQVLQSSKKSSTSSRNYKNSKKRTTTISKTKKLAMKDPPRMPRMISLT